ncbi:hypothetical protein JW796_04240 [Candidatus Dojkabacteria bacterium]|nr:hypothetical protein [Candidatus Dojkabacteria bacterium]
MKTGRSESSERAYSEGECIPLCLPVARISPIIIPVGLKPLDTIRRTIRFFAVEELSLLTSMVEVRARELLRRLSETQEREGDKWIIEQINTNSKVIDSLKEIEKGRGGSLVRRFPIPGYDEVPLLISSPAFQTEPVLAEVNEINYLIGSLQGYRPNHAFDLYTATGGLLNTLYRRYPIDP